VNKTPHLRYLPNPETVRSRRTVVDQVHEILLDAIKSGELKAGDPLHDQTWAAHLKVSRTPIREAIKRMENYGTVSIAPARYTRITTFTPEQARQEATDWALIHLALTSALDLSRDPTLISDLDTLRTRAHTADQAQHDVAIFDFFDRLRTASQNFSLTIGATAAAYRLRLAQPLLPSNPAANHTLCADIITALSSNTVDTLPSVFTRWSTAVTQN